MQDTSAVPSIAAPESQFLEDSAKRAMITSDRVMMLANILMDESMID